ncbi:hypothetical protein GBAR_LOCUS12212 [Geodia barretti]|uniref:ATP-dependent DNA helicase n=1 Tax=Geodia barretti TaxID=519541 RepID=A0AA35RZ32_GEOBA|nr:hypothetical protein GBAR_LOCUS12212 [Geodia barretti]
MHPLLFLFVPFRNEADLIEEGETAESAFERHLEENDALNTHSEKLQRMLMAREHVQKINEARRAQQEDAGTDPSPVEDDAGLQVAGEETSAMNSVLDLHQNNESDGPSLEELVQSLDTDQARVYKHVKSLLEHQLTQEKKQCSCTDLKPLHMFVSGVGGTGKSFLIKTVLIQCPWSHHPSTAIEHEGRGAGYWKLAKDALKIMRASLSKLKLLITDKVSMVSSLNLAYIHLRLDDIFARDEWFGGVNVLFVGDTLQLPPVNGAAVFEKINNRSFNNQAR